MGTKYPADISTHEAVPEDTVVVGYFYPQFFCCFLQIDAEVLQTPQLIASNPIIICAVRQITQISQLHRRLSHLPSLSALIGVIKCRQDRDVKHQRFCNGAVGWVLSNVLYLRS